MPYDRNFYSIKEKLNGHTFSFAQLEPSGKKLTGPNYTALHDDATGFFILKRKKKSTKTRGAGWKVHIDLFPERDNLANAWDSVVPVLKRCHINDFKMMTLISATAPVTEVTQGRHMSLYVKREALSREQWRNLLREINDILIKKGVIPGVKSSVCRSLAGSEYFSYRNDRGHNGNYISVEKASELGTEDLQFNPCSAEDPFQGIILDNQTGCLPCLTSPRGMKP